MARITLEEAQSEREKNFTHETLTVISHFHKVKERRRKKLFNVDFSVSFERQVTLRKKNLIPK